MIEIVITKTTAVEWEADENLIVKETPTQIMEEESYGNKKKVTNIKEYAVCKVKKRQNVERILLKQQIADDDGVDLKAVIAAINGMGPSQ